jgi:hypothetical protein
MLVFDIDGVIRDLTGAMCQKHNLPTPQVWYYYHDGLSYMDYLRKDRSIYLTAQPTEYFQVIKQIIVECLSVDVPVELWTHQTDHNFCALTRDWVAQHLPICNGLIKFKTGDEKIDSLSVNDLLVEDNPTLKSFDNVVLIDRIYNQSVVCSRVKSPQELKRYIADYLMLKYGFKLKGC